MNKITAWGVTLAGLLLLLPNLGVTQLVQYDKGIKKFVDID